MLLECLCISQIHAFGKAWLHPLDRLQYARQKSAIVHSVCDGRSKKTPKSNRNILQTSKLPTKAASREGLQLHIRTTCMLLPVQCAMKRLLLSMHQCQKRLMRARACLQASARYGWPKLKHTHAFVAYRKRYCNELWY